MYMSDAGIQTPRNALCSLGIIWGTIVTYKPIWRFTIARIIPDDYESNDTQSEGETDYRYYV
jgi:hypothetical protein